MHEIIRDKICKSPRNSSGNNNGPVETSEGREFATQCWRIPCQLLSHRPSSQSFVYMINSLHFSGLPAENIPEKYVDRISPVFGTKISLDSEPMIVVEILLLRFRKAHQ